MSPYKNDSRELSDIIYPNISYVENLSNGVDGITVVRKYHPKDESYYLTRVSCISSSREKANDQIHAEVYKYLSFGLIDPLCVSQSFGESLFCKDVNQQPESERLEGYKALTHKDIMHYLDVEKAVQIPLDSGVRYGELPGSALLYKVSKQSIVVCTMSDDVPILEFKLLTKSELSEYLDTISNLYGYLYSPKKAVDIERYMAFKKYSKSLVNIYF